MIDNGPSIPNINELDLRLLILEEKVDLLINNKLISSYFKEQKRLLNLEYSNLLVKLKKEFNKYNPKEQYNIKRILLSSIPDHNVHIAEYINTVIDFCNKYKLDINIVEYEIYITKLGFVKNNMVNRTYVSKEKYEAYLEAL